MRHFDPPNSYWGDVENHTSPNQVYQPVVKFQNIEESDLRAVQLEQNDIEDKDSTMWPSPTVKRG